MSRAAKLTLLALLIGATAGLAIGMRVRFAASASGSFTPGETITVTNAGILSFYAAGADSNMVKVGVQGVASTSDIASATAALASTSYVHQVAAGRTPTNYVHTLIITNLPTIGTNLVLRTDDGTNGYWHPWP